MCIVVSEFQGGRGNQATRSRTEWECKTECFGTIEIEMCVLHVHYLIRSTGVWIDRFYSHSTLETTNYRLQVTGFP